MTETLDIAAYSVAKLASDLGLSHPQLSRLTEKVDSSGYTPFPSIKKGKKRVFAAPNPALKRVQRALAKRLLRRLPVSDHVFSTPGRDVVRNAERHLAGGYRLSLDLMDCYPSTSLSRIRNTLVGLGLDSNVAAVVARLATYKGLLPQGSACSGAILDLVLYSLDESLGRLAAESGCTYTRFVDDITFSGPVPLQKVGKQARRLIRAYGYKIRDRKTLYSGRGELHEITGIAVDHTMHAPRGYVIRVEAHIRDYRQGGTSKEQSIRGMIQWVARLNKSEASVLERQLRSASYRRPNEILTSV